MEKYETQRIMVNGKQVIFYSWRFTTEETKDLNKALTNFSKDKVAEFINGLEEVCLLARQFMKERNVIFQRAERKRMLGRFEKAEQELYTLIDRHKDDKQNVSLKTKKNLFDDSIFSCDAMILEKERLHYLMLAAASQLKEINDILKNESANKVGRPSADVATGDLVKVIAYAFSSYFSKPTAHLSINNPFLNVVKIALEACDLPFDDPSRHIRAAIKML